MYSGSKFLDFLAVRCCFLAAEAISAGLKGKEGSIRIK